MPFGPTNDPAFYTAMMKDRKGEWDNLFAITLLDIKIYDGREINMSAAQVLTFGGKKLVSGSKVN